MVMIVALPRVAARTLETSGGGAPDGVLGIDAGRHLILAAAAQHNQARVLASGERKRRDRSWPSTKCVGHVVVAGSRAVERTARAAGGFPGAVGGVHRSSPVCPLWGLAQACWA